MPIINVTVTGKPDAALSARIAGEINEITATQLRKDPTLTAVAVTYHDPQHWFAGGKSLAEHGANTFWLDIKVVDGTNTKLELEAYLKAIFEAFGRILGMVARGELRAGARGACRGLWLWRQDAGAPLHQRPAEGGVSTVSEGQRSHCACPSPV